MVLLTVTSMWCSWWIILVAAVVAFLLVGVIAGVMARCCRRRAPQKPPMVAQYPIRAGSNYAQYGPAYYNGVGSTGEPCAARLATDRRCWRLAFCC